MKSNPYSFIWALVVLLCSAGAAKAQYNIQTAAWGDHIPIRSYADLVDAEEFKLQIAITTANVNIPAWQVQVRLEDQIRNQEGKVLDPSKVRIRINNVSGAGPNKSQLGNLSTLVLSRQYQNLMSGPSWPLSTGPTEWHKQFVISFDILIEGGAYLEALKSNSLYDLKISFAVLAPINNQLTTLSSVPTQTQIHINPAGVPTPSPTYSLQINNSAVRNGLLELISSSDYIKGASQRYEKGLSVISSTPYALQVKTQSEYFESANSRLPVNTVNVELADPAGGQSGRVALSSASQTVIGNLDNKGTQARYFDIRYFTQPGDTRLMQAQPDLYKSVLLYTLMPQ